MRLIDADICLHEAWQNFYKQEDDHEKNIDGYDTSRDRFYEQSGFECCQQTIVNAPTVEAIPKDQYETQLKADLIAKLTELHSEIEELPMYYDPMDINDLIQEKINSLKVENEVQEG